MIEVHTIHYSTSTKSVLTRQITKKSRQLINQNSDIGSKNILRINHQQQNSQKYELCDSSTSIVEKPSKTTTRTTYVANTYRKTLKHSQLNDAKIDITNKNQRHTQKNNKILNISLISSILTGQLI